ncbi:DUF7667 family protein [Paenibacillus alkalitolerans]
MSQDEELELYHCLKANISLCFQAAYLHYTSKIALKIGDVDWQNEIKITENDMNLY